jgi:hypothetical protein
MSGNPKVHHPPSTTSASTDPKVAIALRFLRLTYDLAEATGEYIHFSSSIAIEWLEEGRFIVGNGYLELDPELEAKAEGSSIFGVVDIFFYSFCFALVSVADLQSPLKGRCEIDSRLRRGGWFENSQIGQTGVERLRTQNTAQSSSSESERVYRGGMGC